MNDKTQQVRGFLRAISERVEGLVATPAQTAARTAALNGFKPYLLSEKSASVAELFLNSYELMATIASTQLRKTGSTGAIVAGSTIPGILPLLRPSRHTGAGRYPGAGRGIVFVSRVLPRFVAAMRHNSYENGSPIKSPPATSTDQNEWPGACPHSRRSCGGRNPGAAHPSSSYRRRPVSRGGGRGECSPRSKLTEGRTPHRRSCAGRGAPWRGGLFLLREFFLRCVAATCHNSYNTKRKTTPHQLRRPGNNNSPPATEFDETNGPARVEGRGPPAGRGPATGEWPRARGGEGQG